MHTNQCIIEDNFFLSWGCIVINTVNGEQMRRQIWRLIPASKTEFNEMFVTIIVLPEREKNLIHVSTFTFRYPKNQLGNAIMKISLV